MSSLESAGNENTRIRLLKDFEGLCGICKEPIDPRAIDDERCTIDHVIPRVFGGPDAYWNLQPAHLRCNRQKSKEERRTGDRPCVIETRKEWRKTRAALL